MRNVFLFISILTIFFFSACSTKSADVTPTIVFPAYPDEPKILYLDTYRGGVVQAGDSGFSAFLDTFLGEGSSGDRVSNIVKPYGTGLLNGRLYVADPGTKSLFVIDENTSSTKFLGTGVIGALSSPTSIAFDKDDNVYVSDSRQKIVQGYSKAGKHIFTLGGRLVLTHPTGIAIDENLSRLYVVDTKAHQIKAFDIETKEPLFTIGKRGREDGEFNFPTNVAVDRRNGNLVVCDTQNFRVQIFDKNGNFIRRFGKVGDRPGMFARPKGVAVDSEGHIYVTDSAFNNIQIFNDAGDLLLWFGSAGYGPTQFRLITGIYIGKDDKIAIADGFSGRVQTFQYISEKWKNKNPSKYEELKEFKTEEELESKPESEVKE